MLSSGRNVKPASLKPMLRSLELNIRFSPIFRANFLDLISFDFYELYYQSLLGAYFECFFPTETIQTGLKLASYNKNYDYSMHLALFLKCSILLFFHILFCCKNRQIKNL